MAAVELTADMPMSPQDMWDHVSDLAELGDWLVMHEAWRSELPDELSEGIEIVGVARAKGIRKPGDLDDHEVGSPRMRSRCPGSRARRNKVWRRAHREREGKPGPLGLRLELGGRALFGPVGSAAARAVKGDVEKSLKNFVELYG